MSGRDTVTYKSRVFFTEMKAKETSKFREMLSPAVTVWGFNHYMEAAVVLWFQLIRSVLRASTFSVFQSSWRAEQLRGLGFDSRSRRYEFKDYLLLQSRDMENSYMKIQCPTFLTKTIQHEKIDYMLSGQIRRNSVNLKNSMARKTKF